METFVQPLPKWLMKRYAVLWKNFGGNPFEFNQAVTVLAEKERTTSVLLSKMKKSGWVEPRITLEDSRKRVYVLKAPNEAMSQMVVIKENVGIKSN
jgi:hypothetical protein